MAKLRTVALLILAALAACPKAKQAPEEIKLAADLSQTEIPHLDSIIKNRKVYPQTKVDLEPDQGVDPQTLLMGQNQPDLFELDYKDRLRMRPFSQKLGEIINSDYDRSLFATTFFQPGVIDSQYYYLPFRLRWLAFLYNAERVPEPPADFPALAVLCADHPGGLGIAIEDDGIILEFMMTLVWAFQGEEFDLDNANTKKALYYLQGISSCVIPYSRNYNSELLAAALAKGEIDFALAELKTAARLWENGSYPHPIMGRAFPVSGAVAFTGTYLAVNQSSQKREAAYGIGFHIANPNTCARIISDGLWLCALPNLEEPTPRPARTELFKPYLLSPLRMKPVPASVDTVGLASVYRQVFERIVFKSEKVEMVAADLNLSLKQVESGLWGK